MRFTVFTPTYNRGYTLNRLYESIKNQSFADFEWIIVDDGSTDNTEDIVNTFVDDSSIKIIYRKTVNGGKHRAINVGLTLATGDLFFIVDSDDYLEKNALEVIDSIEKSIPEEDKAVKYAGVCGQRGYSSDKSIGTTFEGEYLDITTLERDKYQIYGDKAEVFYTSVLKRYPFPEYENEKFLTECVVWDKISYDGYLLRFFNDITIICNYLPDGLTAKYQQLLVDNPKGYGLYLYQSVKFGKLKGIVKWNEYTKFYYSLRDTHSFLDISKFLYINPIKFWIRLLGVKIYNKLYDAWG